MEIEELVFYNMSYNITEYETLELINRLDLLDYFEEQKKWIKCKLQNEQI